MLLGSVSSPEEIVLKLDSWTGKKVGKLIQQVQKVRKFRNLERSEGSERSCMQTCFPQGPMPSGALTGIPNVGFCDVMSCLRKNASRCAGSLLYKLIFAILAEMAPEWNGAMKWLLAESVFWKLNIQTVGKVRNFIKLSQIVMKVRKL